MKDQIEINRRQAIGFAAVLGSGSRGFRHEISAAEALGEFPQELTGLATQIRTLHTQLHWFNREIVQRFVDGRGDAPTYSSERADRFLALSLYLRKKLDQRSVQDDVEFDAKWLHERLEELHVRSKLDCSQFDVDFIRHPAMGFLRGPDDLPGHAFASLAWGCTPERIANSAAEICEWLELPAEGVKAFGVIRECPIDEVECSFAVMDRGDYLELIEALFMIRPETPVSFLALQSRPSDSDVGFRSVMSNVCGNVMERLANNYFHQTLAISELNECNGSWHGFIAGQVFDILMQKWLWLMGGPPSDEPIELEEADDLSLAMKRGVVEGMLHASSKRINPPRRS